MLVHCESKKHATILLSIAYLCEILTDFKSSFTDTLWKICNKPIVHYPATPELCRYTTLWNINVCKTNNSCSQYILDTSESSDQNCSRRSVRHWIDCVRPVSLNTWHAERCVCGWFSWLSTSLSTAVSASVVRFSSASTCFGLQTSPSILRLWAKRVRSKLKTTLCLCVSVSFPNLWL